MKAGALHGKRIVETRSVQRHQGCATGEVPYRGGQRGPRGVCHQGCHGGCIILPSELRSICRKKPSSPCSSNTYREWIRMHEGGRTAGGRRLCANCSDPHYDPHETTVGVPLPSQCSHCHRSPVPRKCSRPWSPYPKARPLVQVCGCLMDEHDTWPPPWTVVELGMRVYRPGARRSTQHESLAYD